MDKLKIHFLNTIWSDAIILENNKKVCYYKIQSYKNEKEVTLRERRNTSKL